MPKLVTKPALQQTQTTPQTGLNGRIQAFEGLVGRLVPVPQEWLTEGKKGGKSGRVDDSMDPIECQSYQEVRNAWRKAMRWTDGLDCALTVMLASAMSTNLIGEQLWIKTIGPPSCGKTTLLEGLATNKKHVLSRDTLTGFHSGWKSEGGEDNSLISFVKGKTLAIKDGDTLLRIPNRAQVLSEARSIYDGAARTHYRNNVIRDYEGHRMTFLLCGTSALREIDDSELGARFLDCVVMDEIDDDFEDEVAWRAVNQESRAILQESNCKPVSTYSPEQAQAMKLTGGYVEWLKAHAGDLYSQVYAPDERKKKCTKLAKFVSLMRARPSQNEEDANREFSARLSKQIMRLAWSVAVVMNKKKIDDAVMKIVSKVAMDTSRGHTLEIVALLTEYEEGLDPTTIAALTNRETAPTRKMLRFLQRLRVVESFSYQSRRGVKPKPRWRLTPKMENLYWEVVGE